MNDEQTTVVVDYRYDGPHSADSVTAAAAGLAELVRYMNNATGPWNAKATLPYAATIDRVLACLQGAVGGLDQLLRQLRTAMEQQADHPSLYDDRFDRPGRDTALEVAALLQRVHARNDGLHAALQECRARTQHLGNKTDEYGNRIGDDGER